MKKTNLTCVECPMGCQIEVVCEEDGSIVSVNGNSCPRGKMYAENEVTCPMRVITSTVKTDCGKMLSVKSDRPIKRANMSDAIKKINTLTVKMPVNIGDVLWADFCDGANLVATDDLR